MSLSARKPSLLPPPAHLAATLLVVVLWSVATVALAQERAEAPDALTAVRVVDAATGDVVATLSDGDTLDLSGSAVRTVVLEPIDVDEATRSVAFTVDDESPSVVNAPPFVLGDLGVAEGTSGTLELPVLRGEDDAEEFIEASMRDAEQFPAGFTYHTSSDLDLVFDPNHGRQVIGIRFDDVDLPPNATITSAAIVFTADGTLDGDVTLTIRGERDGASQPFPQDTFETGTSSISTRRQTTASVTWVIEEQWQNNQRYESPDVTSLVHEIVSWPDWRPGAPLTFIIEGSEGPALRRAYSYDGRRTPGREPMLRLSYSAQPEAVATPITLPEGESTLVVTPYGRWSAAGDEGPRLRARIVTTPGAADPVAEPDEPAEPAADAAVPVPPPVIETEPEPEPEPAPAAAEPEAPAAAEPPQADEPSVVEAEAEAPSAVAPVSGTVSPLWDSDVHGTIFVERDEATGGARVTVQLDEPAAASLSLEIRSGTCSAPGEVLARLAPIGVGERSSTSTVPTSTTGLRFGGFVIFVRSGTPVGCGQITP